MKMIAGKCLLLGAGIASSAAGNLLLAQGPGSGQQPPRPVLQALDTNHDGTLSAAEIAAAPASLARLDTNGDGQLTSFEFLPRPIDPAAADPEALVRRLMALDRNGDGVLTADEIPERMQTMMLRVDLDHDGRITPDEIRAYARKETGPMGRQQRGAQVTRMDPILDALDTDHDGVLSATEIRNSSASLLTLDRNGDGQLTPDETRPRQATPADRANHMLEEWDTNKDGKLSKAEAPDRVQQQFETIDTNHDGSLDLAELTAWFAAQPAQRPRGEGTAPEAQRPGNPEAQRPGNPEAPRPDSVPHQP